LASVVGTSDNPRVWDFNRRQIVGLVHDQIKNRKFEDRVKESQWFLDALEEMHKDIVFECMVVEEKERAVAMWRRWRTCFTIQRRGMLIRLKFKSD
jgi:hypothetical protein